MYVGGHGLCLLSSLKGSVTVPLGTAPLVTTFLLPTASDSTITAQHTIHTDLPRGEGLRSIPCGSAVVVIHVVGPALRVNPLLPPTVMIMTSSHYSLGKF